jgi:hypothetical protein
MLQAGSAGETLRLGISFAAGWRGRGPWAYRPWGILSSSSQDVGCRSDCNGIGLDGHLRDLQLLRRRAALVPWLALA